MTLDPRTIELIQAAFDGELEPDQRQEAEALLDSSPEARALHDELLQLEEQLAAEPDAVAPAGLAGEILDAWEQERDRPSLLHSLFLPLRPAAMGLAFAAGLMMTVAVYEWIPGGGVELDPKTMTGTMVTSPATGALDTLVLEEDGLDGQVRLQRGQDGSLQLLLDFEAEQGGQEITVTLPDVPGPVGTPRTVTITFSRDGQPVYTGTVSK